jgi:alkylhydroperoxidase family enzyme
MSLVPYPDLGKLPDDVRAALDELPVRLNIFRMMANAETCFVPLMRLGGAILTRQQLDARRRELAILLVAHLEGGEYEWIQHVPIGLAVGVTQPQIDALDAGALDAACFDHSDRALLRFTKDVVDRVRADESAVRDVMNFLSPRELVELLITIGFYMTVARITETTRTDLDPPAGAKALESLRR